MSDFIAAEGRTILAVRQLDSVEALCALERVAVDGPSMARGGVSVQLTAQLILANLSAAGDVPAWPQRLDARQKNKQARR